MVAYNHQAEGRLEDDANFEASGRISQQDIPFLDGSPTPILPAQYEVMTMHKLLSLSTVAVLIATTAIAQDRTPDEAKVVELKSESVKQAKFVDFGSELGVSLSAINDLGAKIDAARLAAQPIDLLLAAKLLSAAESLSEKQASLTSSQLQEEAVELAEQRGNPTEIATAAKLIGGDLGDKLMKAAKAAAHKMPKEGDATKDLDGTLVVDNRHNHDEVHVYVNGREMGHVEGHGYRQFHVHGAHYLDARDHEGHRWHNHIEGHHHYWVFRLNPPHPHHPW
ncbi:hypothetical protein Poly24_17700 [Rosistilla carotiformis]|uniref:Uncharacterized protein n=1 Tax=Rosistilla carotiformis TaxID=2528017 RepID=A0A518JRA0_9BACT|nr:hypothetical protein [Rosistilla carotiformis]QDV68064.1 hypothetical protein Poly24_17700 [Rosistilla carotiformis]